MLSRFSTMIHGVMLFLIVGLFTLGLLRLGPLSSVTFNGAQLCVVLYIWYLGIEQIVQAVRMRRPNARMVCNATGIAMEIGGRWTDVIPYATFDDFSLRVRNARRHPFRLETHVESGPRFVWADAKLFADPLAAERFRDEIYRRLHEARQETS